MLLYNTSKNGVRSHENQTLTEETQIRKVEGRCEKNNADYRVKRPKK